MTIKVRKVDNAAILDLDGALRMGEPVQAFRDSIQDLLDEGIRNLGINLAGVPEVDSSGMGALVRSYVAVKRTDGKCRFFGASKKVLQFLRMVRLDNVLDLVEDEAAALRGL